MAVQFMTAIISSRVGAKEPLHTDDQIRLRRLDNQMEMIGHQHESVHLPACLKTDIGERLNETLPVMVIAKDILPPISAANKVIDGAGEFDSQSSGHWLDCLEKA
jgi:hypothetical protein